MNTAPSDDVQRHSGMLEAHEMKSVGHTELPVCLMRLSMKAPV